MATRFRVHRKPGTADEPSPAVPDVPVDLNASATQNADALNAILAALRAHGIIEE